MRSIATLILCFLALSRASFADDDVAEKLIGTWRLISFKVQVVGESTDDRDMPGPQPFGQIIMTPEHTMSVYIAKEDRKGPPTNDAEAASLLSSMNAYTGRYRIEGDKFITIVDGAWNENFKAREQVRYYLGRRRANDQNARATERDAPREGGVNLLRIDGHL